MKNQLILVIACGLLSGCFHSITKTQEITEEVSYIPLGANLPVEEICYPTVQDLPDTNWQHWNEVLAWSQACAIDTSDCAASAFIQIDYWELWEINPDSVKPLLVYQENYDAKLLRGLNANEGGLYVRYPSWYATDEHSSIENLSTIAGGYLYIYPAMAKKGICHWWTVRQKLKPGCRYQIKTRFLISGNLAVQFGVDFWKDKAQWSGNGINNERSWNSRWYGGNGFQEITFLVFP